MIRQVYGWRAVIGYLYPSHGMTIGEEFRKAAPAGVVFHGADMPGPFSWSTEEVRALLDQVEQATKTVAAAGVDVIIQTGVPIGIVNGIGTDGQIIKIMEKASGLPCTTHITAIVEALRHLGITKVIIVTGYFGEKVNQIFYKFMEDSGFKVIAMEDLGINWHNTSDASPYSYYRPSKALYKKFPEAEGILISGGNTFQNDVIEPLEADLGVPVITQRSAALWKVLNMVEIREPIPGLGRLLKMF